jgi:plasmid stabilization system protein ParE
LLTKNLSTFPTLGHMSDPTMMPKAHRFVIGEYLVDYEVLEREVFVFAIRHGRQRPPEQPLDPDDDYEST